VTLAAASGAGGPGRTTQRLSIVIPALDEEARIGAALAALAPLRNRGVEVIVADGGSRDRTVEIARPLADRVIAAPRGRAAQMNAGAAMATGDVFLFLHADTTLPADADIRILQGLHQSGRVWGHFDVRIEGRSPLLPLVAATMNARARLTGIATGDQAMFVASAAFASAGGFPDIALMEDVALSKQLKRIGPPLCLGARATTSGRRWDEGGAARTMLLMWRLRLAYRLGAEPDTLARRYGYSPRDV
jgi:rSAM/selenodomain-associated transferase 2